MFRCGSRGSAVVSDTAFLPHQFEPSHRQNPSRVSFIGSRSDGMYCARLSRNRSSLCGTLQQDQNAVVCDWRRPFQAVMSLLCRWPVGILTLTLTITLAITLTLAPKLTLITRTSVDQVIVLILVLDGPVLVDITGCDTLMAVLTAIYGICSIRKVYEHFSITYNCADKGLDSVDAS